MWNKWYWLIHLLLPNISLEEAWVFSSTKPCGHNTELAATSVESIECCNDWILSRDLKIAN